MDKTRLRTLFEGVWNHLMDFDNAIGSLSHFGYAAGRDIMDRLRRAEAR
jgi:hypothetical protein